MKRALLFALAAAVAVGTATASVVGGPGFSDRVGDAKGGPDITGLKIGEGTVLKGGNVLDTFVLDYTVANLKVAAGGSEAEILTGLDTNRDHNADYFVSFGVDEKGAAFVDMYKAAQLYKKPIPKSATMYYWHTLDNRTHSVQFGSRDIGGATGFDVLVNTILWDADGSATLADRVPNAGVFSYTSGVGAKVVIGVFGTPTLSPATPVAGKPFTLTLPVNRSDTRELDPYSSGTMTCKPTVGGIAVAHKDKFAKGIAKIQLTVPSNAKGRQLRVQVTIKTASQTLKKTITVRIA